MIFTVPILLMAVINAVIAAPNMAELEGTWTSKSNAVFTGPGFYDPVDELLIEPDLPGISYSFTADGYFELALYRVASNSRNHSCATAVLQYQHGEYEIKSNGSVFLYPYAVDGRQLLSDPCSNSENSVYSRYTQPTFFKTYQVFVDNYNGKTALQIYQFDGSMMQPLYLAYKPPVMLPTYALNPTDSASESVSRRKKIKRSLENRYRTNAVKEFSYEKYDAYWWLMVGTLGVASSALLLR